MKNYILPFALSGLMLLNACGPSAEEKAAEQKRIQDSIAKATADSIAAVEAAKAAEQHRIQDSIAAAMEQMRQDSIKMAEEMAKMKKGAAKPKQAPPKEKPKGTGITKGGTEIKSDGKPASKEPPKVTKGGQPIGGGKK
jgi:hypothetical protein